MWILIPASANAISISASSFRIWIFVPIAMQSWAQALDGRLSAPVLARARSFHRSFAEDVESHFCFLVFYCGGHFRRGGRITRRHLRCDCVHADAPHEKPRARGGSGTFRSFLSFAKRCALPRNAKPQSAHKKLVKADNHLQGLRLDSTSNSRLCSNYRAQTIDPSVRRTIKGSDRPSL